MTVRVSSRGASRLPEMLVPPPNGITTASASSAALEDLDDRGLVAGPDHDVGHPAEVATALPDEVAQALAARVDHAVEGVVGDVLVPHRPLERGTQRVAQLRRGDVELSEGERAGRGLRDVDPEVLQEERPEARLVVVGERDTLFTPPPPLHRDRAQPAVSPLQSWPRPYSRSSGGGIRTHNPSVNSRSLCH